MGQVCTNGNQITRAIGADNYNLGYDAEGRMVEVKKNNVVIASFVYDGDPTPLPFGGKWQDGQGCH